MEGRGEGDIVRRWCSQTTTSEEKTCTEAGIRTLDVFWYQLSRASVTARPNRSESRAVLTLALCPVYVEVRTISQRMAHDQHTYGYLYQSVNFHHSPSDNHLGLVCLNGQGTERKKKMDHCNDGFNFIPWPHR